MAHGHWTCSVWARAQHSDDHNRFVVVLHRYAHCQHIPRPSTRSPFCCMRNHCDTMGWSPRHSVVVANVCLFNLLLHFAIITVHVLYVCMSCALCDNTFVVRVLNTRRGWRQYTNYTHTHTQAGKVNHQRNFSSWTEAIVCGIADTVIQSIASTFNTAMGSPDRNVGFGGSEYTFFSNPPNTTLCRNFQFFHYSSFKVICREHVSLDENRKLQKSIKVRRTNTVSAEKLGLRKL